MTVGTYTFLFTDLVGFTALTAGLGASFALFEMSIVLRVMARALDLRPARPERERTKRRAITLVPGRGGEVVAEAVA
jgi:cytochrome P450